MKTKLMINMFLTMMVGFKATNSFAQVVADGKLYSKGGGGGDASELRVNEIRSDILSWIEKNGHEGLKLPPGISVREYESKMTSILQPNVVTIAFVESDSLKNDELKVEVDGRPKTCRGFFSRKDNSPNIICNIARFEKTSPAGQYKLIHHEYAGLVSMEQNIGAASDYTISHQLTDYLEKVTSLKLAVKKPLARNSNGTTLVESHEILSVTTHASECQTTPMEAPGCLIRMGGSSSFKPMSERQCSKHSFAGIKGIYVDQVFKKSFKVDIETADGSFRITEELQDYFYAGVCDLSENKLPYRLTEMFKALESFKLGISLKECSLPYTNKLKVSYKVSDMNSKMINDLQYVCAK